MIALRRHCAFPGLAVKSDYPPEFFPMSLSPPPEWMVLLCGACDTRMKVRRQDALSARLLCPQCHAPVSSPLKPMPPARVEMPPAPPVSPEFSPTPLPARAAPVAPPSLALPSRENTVMQGKSWGQNGKGRPPGGTGFPMGGKEPAEFRGSDLSAKPETPPGRAGDGLVEDEDEAKAEDGEEGSDGSAASPGKPAALLPDRRLAPGETRRATIKKRKVKPPVVEARELTDWDHREMAGIPEAEVEADEWGKVREPEAGHNPENSRDYIVEVVEENGMVRTTRKRVRRRRLSKGAALFFKRLTAMSRGLVAALGLLMVGAAVYGFYVFRQKAEVTAIPRALEPPIDRLVLTSYDEQGAEKAVRDFLAADGMEAKLALVRQPDRIRPLMQDWYRGDRTAGPLQAGEVGLRDKSEGAEGSGLYFVMLAMPVLVPDPLNAGSLKEESTFFAVEEIRQGLQSTYLVDWEVSTGYQQMPLETFKATMPPEPYPFRVFMKEEGYYNNGFAETEWQCVELYYPGRDFQLYGYINRNSPEGQKMLPLIQDGNKAGVIAELKYPEDSASRNQVILKRLLHPSWFYAKPEDAAAQGQTIPPSKS